MVILDPKAQFQSNPETLQAFRNLVRGEVIQKALSLSVVKYTMEALPTSEQAKAIRQFLDIFLNIGEEIKGGEGFVPMPKLIPPEQIESVAKELLKKRKTEEDKK